MCGRESQDGEEPVDVFSIQQLDLVERILKINGVGMVSIYFSKAMKTPVKTSKTEAYYKLTMPSALVWDILNEIKSVRAANDVKKKCDKDFLDALVAKWEKYYRALRGGGVRTSTEVGSAN